MCPLSPRVLSPRVPCAHGRPRDHASELPVSGAAHLRRDRASPRELPVGHRRDLIPAPHEVAARPQFEIGEMEGNFCIACADHKFREIAVLYLVVSGESGGEIQWAWAGQVDGVKAGCHRGMTLLRSQGAAEVVVWDSLANSQLLACSSSRLGMSAAAVGSPFPAAAVFPHRRRGRAGAVQARCSLVAAAAPILDDLRLRCATPLPLLRHVADAMAAGMRTGLAAEGAGELQMIPSYVYSLPTGDETGLFYALDLGGTNFRVLRVQLGGKDRRVVDSESEQVSIPKEIMNGTTEELFERHASGRRLLRSEIHTSS